MEQILAIAEITIKKVKEPAFSILFLIAVVMGYFMSGAEAFSFQNDDVTISAILSVNNGVPLLAGFVMILFMTLLIAVFSGATDIPREIDSRMVMLLLAKPITRGEYIIGKYLGIITICLLFFFIASITSTISYFIDTGLVYNIHIVLRQCFLIIVIFPFVAMAMMISTFLNDIAAMILVAVYTIFAIFISIISILLDLLPKSLGIAAYIHFIAYFVPNLFYFLQPYRLISLTSVSLIIYSLSMTILFLIIATVRLNNTDLI